jgi:hypothetical protein
MLSRRLGPDQLAADGEKVLAGAVLLAPVRLADGIVPKGTRMDASLARRICQAAATAGLPFPLRLAWPEPGDLHEDDAAMRLATAVAGPGLTVGAPSQSRIDLAARVDGVLRIRIEALRDLNRIDPLEVFTLFHGQAVRAGQTVGSVKVAPHLVPDSSVVAGEQVAHRSAPVVNVEPYRAMEVAAIAAEALGARELERFDRSAGTKVSSLGGRFLGTTLVPEVDPDVAAAHLRQVLHDLVSGHGVALILVGGVSAGDPLSPLYSALESLGGRLLRRGVPAHPGSMIWLAGLGDATLLGLPQCGMFSMATAADLVLPRLMTGERVTADILADLGHGGLLGPEMRFRFPDYARHLEAPPT